MPKEKCNLYYMGVRGDESRCRVQNKYEEIIIDDGENLEREGIVNNKYLMLGENNEENSIG